MAEGVLPLETVRSMSTELETKSISLPEERDRSMASGVLGVAGATPCLLCGGDRHRVVFRESDIDILRCRHCGHVFSSHVADPHYDGFWGDDVGDEEHFYWKTARRSMYDAFFKRFLDGRSGRLLDMGSGLGFFVKAAGAIPNWEAHGCEISPAAVRYAREKLGLTTVTCSRLEDAPLPSGSFDMITMWDVIDHIARPDPLLQRCHALLRNSGICVIRTPNVRVQLPRARVNKLLWGIKRDGWYLQPRDHMHHYSTTSIRALMQRNGFANVTFVHLPPVQASGNLVRAVKTLWFGGVRALAFVTAGHVNLDNLFVVARKGPAV